MVKLPACSHSPIKDRTGLQTQTDTRARECHTKVSGVPPSIESTERARGGRWLKEVLERVKKGGKSIPQAKYIHLENFIAVSQAAGAAKNHLAACPCIHKISDPWYRNMIPAVVNFIMICDIK